jgi:hypothetical protein
MSKTCPDCNGDGVVDKDTDNERQCPTCGGLGFVPDDDDNDDGEEVIKTFQTPRASSRLSDFAAAHRAAWPGHAPRTEPFLVIAFAGRRRRSTGGHDNG